MGPRLAAAAALLAAAADGASLAVVGATNGTLAVCAYDRLRFAWTVSGAEAAAHSGVWVGLFGAPTAVGAPGAGALARVDADAALDLRGDGDLPRELHDEAGGPAVAARVVAMRWLPEDWTMALEFDAPTNAPPVADVAAFERLVRMNVALRAASFRWDDGGRTLVVRVNAPGDAEAIAARFEDRSFEAAAAPWPPPRPPPATVEGEARLRLAVAGEYRAALVVGDAVAAVAAANVTVEACADAVVVDVDRAAAADALAPPAPPLAPWWDARGVFASAGDNALKIPAGELPLLGRGDFSLAFWIYVAEEPSGAHRGVFFKGDVGRLGGARTPSAWLLPDSNRLALRVSTHAGGDDVGADTELPLPTYAWTHVVFSFANRTANPEPRADGRLARFVFGFYVDGRRDSTLDFYDDVAWNDGALHLGRDPDRRGFRGAFADAAVFPFAADPAAAAALHAAALATFPPEARDVEHLAPTAFAPPRAAAAEAPPGRGPDAFSVDASVENDGAWDDAVRATEACAPRAARVALYEAAAAGRHAAAASRTAAELLLYGAERRATGPARCARETGAADAPRAAAHLRRAAALRDAAATRMLAVLHLAGLADAAPAARALAAPAAPRGAVAAPAEPIVACAVGAAVAGRSCDDRATAAGLRLLLAAALLGDARAAMALAKRYREGRGVAQSVEAAAWYARAAAAAGRDEYHTVGEQTHVELDRLSDERFDDGSFDDGQRGDDDAAIQAQMLRAEAGDVDALVASGDLLYWGARGVARDQDRARRFFGRAAESGHAHARCLYAAMLLRGEGGPPDHAAAVAHYEAAAAAGSAKALNGLGYEYFYGHTLDQNATKAFGYFSEAARLDADGDSNFNAAHCLATGTGVARDGREAAVLYERAATRHGHFDAAFELALVKYEGRGGVHRDPARALDFFDACARAGWAARDVRAGFDAFLAGDGAAALLWYAEAAEVGFEVAAANAAWLLDRDGAARAVLGAAGPAGHAAHAALRYHRLSASEHGGGDSAAALGDAVRDGALVVAAGGAGVAGSDVADLLATRHARALTWYSRAATAGSPRGAFAMAEMHARGAPGVPRNRDRARRLFETARARDEDRMRAPVFLALALLRLDEWRERLEDVVGFDVVDALPDARGCAGAAAAATAVAAAAAAAFALRPAAPPEPQE